jgi:putative membrane protein
MWLDAILAYLHFLSIFLLFSYLIVELVAIKGELDGAGIRRIARADIVYFIAAMMVLVTGFLRLFLGAKGPDYYLQWWPIYAKVATFVVIGVLSVIPTLAFLRWKRSVANDPAWKVPPEEQRKMRRIIMIELHLAALIPLFAVIMSRGLGR